MWLRFLLMIAIFAVLCNGYEDKYSCDFNGRWCMWYPKNLTDTCNWKLHDGQYQGKQGYIVLDGANNCYAQLRWAFLWFPVNPKMITFEYYVTGPGPYSLNVTSEKSYKPEWTCQIQPGDQKRVGHAAPMRVSNLLIISASVAPGSQLIITQVWKYLQGHKAESRCPPLSTGNTTKSLNDGMKTTPRHVPGMSKPEISTAADSLTTSVATKIHNSTMETSSFFLKNLLSLKGKLLGLIRNITLSIKIDYAEDKKTRSKTSTLSLF